MTHAIASRHSLDRAVLLYARLALGAAFLSAGRLGAWWASLPRLKPGDRLVGRAIGLL